MEESRTLLYLSEILGILLLMVRIGLLGSENVARIRVFEQPTRDLAAGLSSRGRFKLGDLETTGTGREEPTRNFMMEWKFSH